MKEAHTLSAAERALLIEDLFHSFDTPDQQIREQKWANESEERIDAFEAGKLSAVSLEDIKKELFSSHESSGS